MTESLPEEALKQRGWNGAIAHSVYFNYSITYTQKILKLG
ncbi:protein of unknown function [Methylotuvimicrobium alcaliphilum 20Z]|uniref:Uncharacterized protein n=1 Tax=Methylotuvimicrobium alcaliphilum (strain DSM 19304 / NCIMB 14124 / VKM B-2133 / 20Z) TaxID=1091494 RepID=G4T3E9_META2|nr:protein of unknown function [Methylotuvimicrobium alcaliphilum 20Z]